MNQRDLLHTGDIYFPNDPTIMEDQLRWLDRLYDFNNTRPTELRKREKLLRKMFAELGEGCYIEPPLHTNMGGHHVHFGSHIYANFGLTLVDDTTSMWATTPCSAPMSPWPPPVIPSSPVCGKRDCSTTCPCASAATAGSAQVH